MEALNCALRQGETRDFLERFVDARIGLAAFGTLLGKLQEVKNVVEAAKQTIIVKELAERQAEEARRAEADIKEAEARRKAEEERRARDKQAAIGAFFAVMRTIPQWEETLPRCLPQLTR